VKIFLDTSVLVPVFLGDHPHHSASIALFSNCDPATANCAAHSLAEVYATLTRIPAPHRASPDRAIKCVERIATRLRLITLDGPAYLAAIQSAASQNIVGGTTYDALIGTCALHSGANQIYSWNTRHFEKFGSDVASKLLIPPSN